jgi:hypothetical protein
MQPALDVGHGLRCPFPPRAVAMPARSAWPRSLAVSSPRRLELRGSPAERSGPTPIPLVSFPRPPVMTKGANMSPQSFAIVVAAILLASGAIGFVLQRLLPEKYTTGASRESAAQGRRRLPAGIALALRPPLDRGGSPGPRCMDRQMGKPLPQTWKDFLLGLRRRGLNGVEFVVADDHAGLRMAIREVFRQLGRRDHRGDAHLLPLAAPAP